jgi:hypothetical protein
MGSARSTFSPTPADGVGSGTARTDRRRSGRSHPLTHSQARTVGFAHSDPRMTSPPSARQDIRSSRPSNKKFTGGRPGTILVDSQAQISLEPGRLAPAPPIPDPKRVSQLRRIHGSEPEVETHHPRHELSRPTGIIKAPGPINLLTQHRSIRPGRGWTNHRCLQSSF